MKKIYYFFKHWKVLGPLILLIGCFCLIYFVQQILPVKSEVTCPLNISNTTFLKSYRLLAFTKINGAWPTKDGGYIVSGTTDPNIMFIPPDGFVAKLDKQGNVQWLKLLKTTNAKGAGNPRGDEDVQAIIELKDGGYLMASKVWGFITSKEWSSESELNKILFTKLDKKGQIVWSKSFTGFVEDARNSLLETTDKGFLFYANVLDLEPSKRGEDSDVYSDLPFASLKVFKFDLNGNLKWSKNIKNFISRKNDSYLVPTADNGYVLAGNITETNPEKSLPYNFDTYPGLVKFDKDFNFQWAKSLEGIPYEMAAAIPKAEGGYELGSVKMRQGASNIHGLVKTSDNGYLVLGNLSMAMSLMTESLDLNSGLPHSYLIGFKYDAQGNLEWVKRITLSFAMYNGPMINFSMSLTKDNNILITGPITWTNSAITIRPSMFIMKTDQNLNVSWTKIANPQRSTTNYVLKTTSDNGAIIAGEYETNIVKSISFGSPIYYKDGFLMKLDASGNVKDNKNWLINYTDKITTEMMTPYATTNNLTVQTENYKINLTKRQPEFSVYKKTKVTTYAPFKSSKTTACPITPNISTSVTPLQNSNNPSTAERTWPQINYEKAVPIETVNEKSTTLHNELLPILNQLYSNQVKLTDNMSGSMLSYVLGRLVVKDDMIAVKNYLVNLGYKTQAEDTYQLTMYKPGYFLVMTFSMNHTDKAFLNITF